MKRSPSMARTPAPLLVEGSAMFAIVVVRPSVMFDANFVQVMGPAESLEPFRANRDRLFIPITTTVTRGGAQESRGIRRMNCVQQLQGSIASGATVFTRDRLRRPVTAADPRTGLLTTTVYHPTYGAVASVTGPGANETTEYYPATGGPGADFRAGLPRSRTVNGQTT